MLKIKITSPRILREFLIEDDEIMVSFEVTFLDTNIPIIDTLNIIKDYVNNDVIPQDKFLHLVNLVLTTSWYTLNSQFYQQTDGVAMGAPESSTTEEFYMQFHELAFCDLLLKQNNGKISVLVYRKPTHTYQYQHYSSYHQTTCKESVVSFLFNRAYAININTLYKMTYTKKKELGITVCLSHNNKRKPQIFKRKIST